VISALIDAAYATNDAALVLSLATVRSQVVKDLHGAGPQHAASLGELVCAQLYKCDRPAAIKQVRELVTRRKAKWCFFFLPPCVCLATGSA
jgi:hypothetical protein